MDKFTEMMLAETGLLGMIGLEYCKVRRNALRARPGTGRRRSRN